MILSREQLPFVYVNAGKIALRIYLLLSILCKSMQINRDVRLSNMITEKQRHMQPKSPFSLTRLPCLLLILAALGVSSVIPEDIDPVLEFYWGKAAQAASALVNDSDTISYRIRALSYYHQIDKRGRITSTDSLLANYFFSSGRLDSLEVIAGEDNSMTRADFSVLDVFSRPYLISLYPNDTGGVELAIGFDSDSTHLGEPVGLLLIDRYNYYPRFLYTHYPDTSEFVRYSRSYRFALLDGIFYADSIWVSAATRGIYSRENYRFETGVQALSILR